MARGRRTGIYRSKFEANFAANFPKLKYESDKIRYTWPERTTNYTPDWKVTDNVYLETKGRFEPQDRQKLLLIKEQHPDVEIALVFQNPNLVLGKRLGTVMTWGKKNGFTCFAGSDTLGIKQWISDKI